MKFEDVTDDVVELFEKVRVDYNFSDVSDAKFKLVYRNKRKGKDDFLTIAEICSTSEMTKFLTSTDTEDGFDYLVIIDKNIFEALEEPDKIRVLRHELRHTNIVVNEKNGTITYGTRRHTVEDFYEDLDIENKPDGDPQWKDRVVSVGISVYENMEAEKKLKKGKKKKG